MVNPSLYSSSVVKVNLGSTRPFPQGRHWDDGGGYTGIRSITVAYSRLEVSMIQVEYDLFGKPVLGEEHRGTTWASTFEITRKEKVILDFPSEVLIAVSYRRALDNLYFKTNKRMIGLFAEGISITFSPGIESATINPWSKYCSVDGGTGAIVGFFGLADEYIRSIGLYITVLCPTADFFDKIQEQGLMPYRTSPLSTPSSSSTM